MSLLLQAYTFIAFDFRFVDASMYINQIFYEIPAEVKTQVASAQIDELARDRTVHLTIQIRETFNNIPSHPIPTR